MQGFFSEHLIELLATKGIRTVGQLSSPEFAKKVG
jgi:hypothetical protein